MKKCSLLLILAIFFACSSDSDQPEPNPNPPTQGEEDTTAPTITISGLQDLIEVLTTLEVIISDESDSVNTAILVNGEEVFTTTQKSFSYELDPFDFPSGETTITVQSTDDSDNRGSDTETFELKKLLFRWSDLAGGPQTGFTYDTYMAINDEETGELIMSKKIETVGDAVFYAPENFEKKEFVASQYLLGNNDNIAFNIGVSFADLLPGTEVLTNEQAREVFNLLSINILNQNTFDLNINDIPNDATIQFSSIDYRATGDILNGYTFEYDTERVKNIFLYSSSDNTNDLLSYRYFLIDSFSNKTISFNDFQALAPTEKHTVNLPEETQSLSFELRGFLDETQYNSDSFNQIYTIRGDAPLFNGVLNFPIIEEYEILQQRLTVNLGNGKTIRSNFRGLNDLEIPNTTAERIDDEIFVTGTFDYSELTIFIDGAPIPGNPNIPNFWWIYNNDESSKISIPFEKIEIPENVISNLTEKGYDLNDVGSPSNFNLKLIQHELEVSYYDRLFYNIQRNERGDLIEVNYNFTF